jgi:hypothetical protein
VSARSLNLRPALTAAAIAAVLLGAATLARQSVWGNFTGKAPDAGNSITAAADFRAPTVSGSAIGKTTGGVVGQIKKGGTYYVYANAGDTGNPASGVSTVTANVNSITSGTTAAPLTAGSFTAGGVSYGYRSAALTAGTGLTAGSYSYTLTSTDTAGNSKTQSGYSVTVDNTVPTGTDVQTVNGGTSGLAEAGDKVVFSFSKAIDPNSVLAGWNSGSTNVVVRLTNAGSSNDTVTVFNSTNTTQLPLGSVNLGRADYTGASITFGATGTASSMVMSGTTITITLGTQSAAATTAAGTGTMSWTPSASATDAAGNGVSTTAMPESGTVDLDF